jgi:hypothetical protein
MRINIPSVLKSTINYIEKTEVFFLILILRVLSFGSILFAIYKVVKTYFH